MLKNIKVLTGCPRFRLLINLYKNFSKFPLKQKRYNKDSSKLENFSYKIQEFDPNDSKYSFDSKEGSKPIADSTSPGLKIPKYIEENQDFFKNKKDEKIERNPFNPDDNKDKSNNENNEKKITHLISADKLKSGQKSTIYKKPFQRKFTKEERVANRKNIYEANRQKLIENKETRELLENDETSILRQDLKYIQSEKTRLKTELTKIRQQKSIERRRIYNTENLVDFEASERLSKRIARLGIASRRQAEKLIQAGMIKVDGKTVTMNVSITDKNLIQVHSNKGHLTPIPESTRIWLFNKPSGYCCNLHDDKVKPFFYQLIEQIEYISVPPR